jgi:hypothetical protein
MGGYKTDLSGLEQVRVVGFYEHVMGFQVREDARNLLVGRECLRYLVGYLKP